MSLLWPQAAIACKGSPVISVKVQPAPTLCTHKPSTKVAESIIVMQCLMHLL